MKVEQIQKAQSSVDNLQSSVAKVREMLQAMESCIEKTGLIDEQSQLAQEINKVVDLQKECRTIIGSLAGAKDDISTIDDMRAVVETSVSLIPLLAEYKKAIEEFNSLYSDNEKVQALLDAHHVDVSTIEWLSYTAEQLEEKYEKYVDFMELYRKTLNVEVDDELFEKVLTSFGPALVMQMAQLKMGDIHSETFNDSTGESTPTVSEKDDTPQVKAQKVEPKKAAGKAAESAKEPVNRAETKSQSKAKAVVQDDVDASASKAKKVVRDGAKSVVKTVTEKVSGEAEDQDKPANWEKVEEELKAFAKKFGLDGDENIEPFTYKKFRKKLEEPARARGERSKLCSESMSYIPCFEQPALCLRNPDDISKGESDESMAPFTYLESIGVIDSVEIMGLPAYVLSNSWYQAPEREKILQHVVAKTKKNIRPIVKHISKAEACYFDIGRFYFASQDWDLPMDIGMGLTCITSVEARLWAMYYVYSYGSVAMVMYLQSLDSDQLRDQREDLDSKLKELIEEQGWQRVYFIAFSLNDDPILIEDFIAERTDIIHYYHYNVLTDHGISYAKDMTPEFECDDFASLVQSAVEDCKKSLEEAKRKDSEIEEASAVEASASDVSEVESNALEIDEPPVPVEAVEGDDREAEELVDRAVEELADVASEEQADTTDEELDNSAIEPVDTGIAEVADTSVTELSDASVAEAASTSVAEASDTSVAETGDTFTIDYKEILAQNRSREEIQTKLQEMLSAGKFYCAAAYMHAIAMMDESYRPLQELLSYALRDPMVSHQYDGQGLIAVTNVEDDLADYLSIAGALRVFFGSPIEYDNMLEGVFGTYQNNAIFDSSPSLKRLYYKLHEFKSTEKLGVYTCAQAASTDEDGIYQSLRDIQQEAKDMIDLRANTNQVSIPRLGHTRKLLFTEGDVYECMKIVETDHTQCDESVLQDDNACIEMFLREKFFSSDHPLLESNLNERAVQAYVYDAWDRSAQYVKVAKKSGKPPQKLMNQVISDLKDAICLLVKWHNLTKDWDVNKSKRARDAFVAKKEDLLKAAREAQAELSVKTNSLLQDAGNAVLCYVVSFIEQWMEGTFDEFNYKGFYTPFLFNNYICLINNQRDGRKKLTEVAKVMTLNDWKKWVPDLRINTGDVVELYPFARIEEHAMSEEKSLSQRIDEIMGCGQEDGTLAEPQDDYGTAILLQAYARYKNIDTDIIDEVYDPCYVDADAIQAKNSFEGDFELARAYNKLDESLDTNTVLRRGSDLLQDCSETHNYYLFKRYIAYLVQTIQEKASLKQSYYLKELNAFVEEKGIDRSDKNDSINRIIDEIEAEIEQQNYAVAEDMLATIKDKEKLEKLLRNQLDMFSQQGVVVDYLEKFLEQYSKCYDRASMNTSLANALRIKPLNKDKRIAKELVDRWNFDSRTDGTAPKRMEDILSFLGFPVEEGGVTQLPSTKNEGPDYTRYSVKLKKIRNLNKAQFSHPIPAFGSEARFNGFRLVLIKRSIGVKELLEAIRSITTQENVIFFFKFPLKLLERRELARKIKEERLSHVMAVIDGTLISYLALNYSETYIQQMLMATMLPFSYCQPYLRDSSNFISPEMFVGRAEELEAIQSPTGVQIVYGGRQLGKSALLRMAKNNIDYDENGSRAILVDIKDLNSEEAAKKISQDLSTEKFFKTEYITSDWQDLAHAIVTRLKDETSRIGYFLLLLDEADAFIESENQNNYKSFNCLKDIGQKLEPGRFKFVVAGLRNIVKFNRKVSLGDNSVISHLTSLTVKPLEYRDAYILMNKPLSYLGFQFPEEKKSLQTMIFATANYFPGLIQLYCANLIEALAEENYAGYEQTNTPPYIISEDHIKRVLSNQDFREQVKQKFEITLRLDSDDYYYIIALLVAYQYHNDHDERGYTIGKIQNEAADLEVRKISDLDSDTLQALFDELVELNVLRASNDGRYLFSRYRFLEFMGTKDEVENEIMTYYMDKD